MSDAYAHLLPQALAGNVLIPGHPLKMGLLTAAYTPNLVGHVHWADVSGHETSGSGYTAGGVTLSGVTLAGPTAANSWGEPWNAANDYLYGDVVRAAPGNGALFMVTQGGTSGGTAPVWNTTPGMDTADGSVTWVCIGGWVTTLSSNPAAWTAATFDAAWGAIYDATSGVLVCLLDIGAQSPASQNFEVEPDPVTGWLIFPPL